MRYISVYSAYYNKRLIPSISKAPGLPQPAKARGGGGANQRSTNKRKSNNDKNDNDNGRGGAFDVVRGWCKV
jgi:hypothetical protein